MALTMITPPGEYNVDVVVGSTQRLGVPMGFGGPHAAFFATKDQFKRTIPGRIIGVTKDIDGNRGLRMALQTREQHIKRERATSNICTAQVLLAVMAAAYTIYHGKDGLKAIGNEIHAKAVRLNQKLQAIGVKQFNIVFFDTLKIVVEEGNTALRTIAESKGLNFFYEGENFVRISVDEVTTDKDIDAIVDVFAELKGKEKVEVDEIESVIPEVLMRKSAFLEDEAFNTYQSEHEMLRYLKRLENKDVSLTHSMISLGSCTMKLNATFEMIPVTFPEVGNIHPFAPKSQTSGYAEMITNLEEWLCDITGFSAVSFQPNSGAQGEYAGLLTIKKYLESRKEFERNIVLIPSSAHGTNPASAVMAGLKVVVVKCDDAGNIEVEDLKDKIAANEGKVAALMVTYPSTHGVFESAIKEVIELVHEEGGQVYMDGANMNAQVGLTSPGLIGADVCHLNLHKTFCIPHGGGGPGMGPIGVAAHLVDHLPNHIHDKTYAGVTTAVSAAHYGSASILPISYMYIAAMGNEGLKEATEIAILNANYIMHRLEGHYPILYKGENGTCAHEFILDCREFKASAGIEVVDIAKRLMDYGFHAPTVSFPVAGTLIVEPTESESKEELAGLSHDVFAYFGLGCRNVSKLFLPKGFDLDHLFKAFYPYSYVVEHKKYGNNYDYNKAIFLMGNSQLIENGFLLLKEDKSLLSPVAMLYYEYYTDRRTVEKFIEENAEQLQCVVSKDEIPFGHTHKPNLWDYADGVDTIEFLRNL